MNCITLQLLLCCCLNIKNVKKTKKNFKTQRKHFLLFMLHISLTALDSYVRIKMPVNNLVLKTT